jgi:hypothetical protein
MMLSRNWKMGLVALLAATLFVATAQRLKSVPRQIVLVEMQVVLPLFVQVFMAAGDRHLAANIAAIRALVVNTFKMQGEEFAILAKLQEDVSWLNPGHEDNYYTATAILPWQGELEATQRILARATKARFYDYQPGVLLRLQPVAFQGRCRRRVGVDARGLRNTFPKATSACRCRTWRRSGWTRRRMSIWRFGWSRQWPSRPSAGISSAILSSASIACAH